WRIGIQGLGDLLSTLVKIGLAGIFLVQRNQLFIVGHRTVALNAGIMQSGMVHGCAKLIIVWRLSEFHPYLGPALEIHTQGNVVPEKHGEDSGQIGRDTSELQSPCNLVCRLLLEKKKIKHKKALHYLLLSRIACILSKTTRGFNAC